MSNHLTEPLDYLYEELSPERMTEARKHLAVCPDCRARVRDIRETVKLYRQIPHPAAPQGLAARAASAALAAAKEPPTPEPIILATPAPARARIPANDAAERRQTKLEEDFERLKQEVKDEMRRGWRQWFFHPAWTIAASALLLASLAIHYSPRERFEQPIRLRGSAPVADAARVLRNRERIPVPELSLADAADEAADDPNQPVMSTPLPPAPAALRAANARRDLPLPSLARMQQRARDIPAQADAAAEERSAPEPAATAHAPKRAESPETAEAEASTELAFAEAAPMPAAAMAAPVPAPAAAAQPPVAAVPSEPAEIAAEPVVLDELAEAEMNVAEADTVIAAATAEPAFDETVADEITPVLTPGELVSLAATPVEADGEASAEDAAPAVIAMADMTPPQIIERPEGFDPAERVRTLSALAGMQIASGEIADAWKTVEMLRRYNPAAAEEISALITEAEKAALSGKDPDPAPEPVPPFPGAMIEPPEDPPMSMVIVPAYMQPAEAEPAISAPVVPVSVPDAALRETLDPSRSAELARTLRQSLDPVIPLQVYIRPVKPAVVAPTPAPAAAPKKAKQKRSAITPYLRDY